MGLFSSIGSIFGPVGNVVGGVADGLMGAKSAKDQRNQALDDERMKYVRLREAAELGGFNPLTAVNTGGAGGLSGLPSGAPPLASTQALSSAVQGVSDVVTGKAAKDAARQELETDLLRLQGDALRTQMASASIGGRNPTPGRIATSGASVATKPPRMSGKEYAEAGYAGPRQWVNAQNPVTGEWVQLDPRVADRFDITEGGVILIEDWEAIFGDIASEALGIGQIVEGGATGKIGGGVYVESPYNTKAPEPKGFAAKPKPKSQGGRWAPNQKGQ